MAKDVAEQAAKIEGVDKVIYVDNEIYDKVCSPYLSVFLQNLVVYIHIDVMLIVYYCV